MGWRSSLRERREETLGLDESVKKIEAWVLEKRREDSAQRKQLQKVEQVESPEEPEAPGRTWIAKQIFRSLPTIPGAVKEAHQARLQRALRERATYILDCVKVESRRWAVAEASLSVMVESIKANLAEMQV